MNNPNPFVPKGSLLEQQNKRRAHMKIGVTCVLAVGVAGLMVMLIQGCSDKKTGDTTADTSLTPADTNGPTSMTPLAESNAPSTDISNQVPITPPTNLIGMAPPSPVSNATPPQLLVQPPTQPINPPGQTLAPIGTDAGSGEYTVAKGDSLAKIAKKNGVSLKALEAANPDAKPTKLKVGQKLVIPAGGKSVAAAPGAPVADTAAEATGETYIVKSGDTLTKIAKAHHVKVKALEAANGLSTTQIKVGKKLKIPGKAEVAAAPAPVETAPAADTTAPQLPPVNTTSAPTLGAPAPH